MSSHPSFAFFGHHKSATGWINSILRTTCFDLGLKFHVVHKPEHFDNDLQLFLKDKDIDFISYTNANFSYAKDFVNKARGFHVVRDPRDIIVSGYFSHKFSHPVNDWDELARHREQLKILSKDEGLLLEMEFSRSFLQDIDSWNYGLPNILEMKMEDMIRNPEKQLERVFSFLGIIDGDDNPFVNYVFFPASRIINNLHLRGRRHLPFQIPISPFRINLIKIPRSRLNNIIEENSFSKKSGNRKRGEEDPKSHYRKGVSGDWKNHFCAEHKQYFKEKYGDLLIKLGYESDSNW